jgi:hypothetical protein
MPRSGGFAARRAATGSPHRLVSSMRETPARPSRNLAAREVSMLVDVRPADRRSLPGTNARPQRLGSVLLLTSGHEAPAEILPSLTLLPHAVRVGPAVAASVTASPPPDAALVDARRDLMAAKRLLQALRAAESKVPVLVIVAEGGWAAIGADRARMTSCCIPSGRARSRPGCGWQRAAPREPSRAARRDPLRGAGHQRGHMSAALRSSVRCQARA